MCASRYPDSKSTDSPHQPQSRKWRRKMFLRLFMEWKRNVRSRLRKLLRLLGDSDHVRKSAPTLEHFVLSTPPAAEGILRRLREAADEGTCRPDFMVRIMVYYNGMIHGFPHPLDDFINELRGRLERLQSGCSLVFGPILVDMAISSPRRALQAINSIDKALKVDRTLDTAAPDIINDVSMYIRGLRPTQPLDTLLDTLFSGLNCLHRDLVYVVSPILLARVFGGSQRAAEELVQKAIELLGTVGGVRDDLVSHRVSIYSTAHRLGLRPKELRDPTLIALLCELFQRFRLLGEDFIDVILPMLVLKAFTTPDVKASEYVKTLIGYLHDGRHLDADDLFRAVVTRLNGLCPNDLIKSPSTFSDIVATAQARLHLLHPDFPHVVMPIFVDRMWNGREAMVAAGNRRILARRTRIKGVDSTSAWLSTVNLATVIVPAGRLIQTVIDRLDQGYKDAVDADEIAGAVIVHLLRDENSLLKNRSAFDVLAEKTARHYKQKFFSVFRDHYVKPPISLLRPVNSLQRNCFNRRAPKTTALHKSLVAYIHDLSDWVRREDFLFRDCALYGIGSYYSGLRTSTIPDEQDWLLSIRALDLGEVPNRDMWAERVEEEGKFGWQVYVREEGPSWRVWSRIDSAVGCLLHIVVDRPGVHQVNSMKLFEYANRLLNRAVSLVPLPWGLFHGGWLAPHFHKVVTGGPASTILLLDPECQEPIDVDVTFGMEVPLAVAGAEAQEVMTSLVKKCGLPPTAPLTLHLVPTNDPMGRWVLSSAVLEARIFAHLGPRSPHVQAVRDLKLLADKFLSWGPLKGTVAEVTEALSAWGERSSGGVVLRIPGVDTTGVAEAVAEILSDEKISYNSIIHKQYGEDGVEVDCFGMYRIWLIVAAVYRHHTGFEAGVALNPDRDRDRDSHGYHPESCQLCASIAKTAGELDHPYHLQPAVAQALRLPVRPRLSVNSAYIKYMVLRDMVQRDKLLLQPDEEQREQMLKRYLKELSQTLEQDTMPHPLLGTPQVRMVTRSRLIPLEAIWREYSSLLHLLESVLVAL